MPDKYNVKFKQYWGHDKLKPLQKQIIKTIVEEPGDSLVVMRTGFGKSVCYQLPFLLMNKSIVVVSPLIALMEDQKQSLIDKNIPVIALNSTMTPKEKEDEKNKILKGENKIIYMSPEYLTGSYDFIYTLYENNQLAFIAIDEAHCVSSWGHDFRPDYNALSCLKEWMEDIPIMALTATATKKTRDDIVETLNLEEYYEFVSSFDRPNLYLECKQKSSSIEKDFDHYVNNYYDHYCIVYARTIDNVKKVCEHINNCGIEAHEYHGKMTSKQRSDVQTRFSNGEFKWIIATVAFGMGIDQDITLVIHYGAPGDLESYYQEIGRAGRNGEASICSMIFGNGDMVVNRLLLNDEVTREHKKYKERQIKYMEEFIRDNVCRRKNLLKYFGEKVKKTNCGNCDNCLRDQTLTTSINEGLQWPLFAFKCFMAHESVYSGITNIVNVILGKKIKAIEKYHKCLFFNIGKKYCSDPKFWKKISEILLLNEYIEDETIPSGRGVVLKPTLKLKSWYNDIKPIVRENQLKGFDIDNYMVIKHLVNEEYEIPSTCMDIEPYIKKHTVTALEEGIQAELSRLLT